MDVAVVAVIVSGIVGLGGLLIPAWLTHREGDQAERRRLRDRREAVYLDALELSHLVSRHEVGSVYGDIYPSIETVSAAYERTHAERTIQARMDAYGSPEMRELWRIFAESWDAVEVGRQESLETLAHSAGRMADQVNKELG